MANENKLSNLSDIELKEYYEKTFLEELRGQYNLYKFCKKGTLPKNKGTSVTWRLFKSLHYPVFKVGDKAPDGTTIESGSPLIGQLKELGEIPDDTPNKLELMQFIATIHKYGDRLLITEDVNLKAIDPVMREATQLLGEEAGELFEKKIAQGMVSGTNVFVSEDTDGSKIVKEIRKIKKYLQKQHVKKVGGYYIGICDSDFEEKLKNATASNASWTDISKYANPKEVYQDEIGHFLGIRWVVNDNLPKKEVTTGSGQSATTVTKSQVIIMGKDAIGTVNLEGQSNRPKIIIHAPGSSGINDPYNEITSIAWINRGFTTRILRDEALVRYEIVTDATDLTTAVTDATRKHLDTSVGSGTGKVQGF